MFGTIPELGYQIPELGGSDEIQNYLHGGANVHDAFRVMDTIVDRFTRGSVCPELVAALRSARAVMWVKMLANHIEVTDTLMTISESYRLCRHESELPCGTAIFEVNLDLVGYILGERLWEVLQRTLKNYEKLRIVYENELMASWDHLNELEQEWNPYNPWYPKRLRSI